MPPSVCRTIFIDINSIFDMGEAGQNVCARSLRIAAVVALYWVVSISMVFCNKYLLSSQDIKLDAPLFVTWFQCVFGVATGATLTLVSRQHSSLASSIPQFTGDFATALNVMPLSLIFIGMITFNNLALKYLGVAFYTVGRSLTTIFNVLLTYFLLHQTTSLLAISSCGVIISGFLLGVNQERQSSGAVSSFGIACGILASLFVALNAVFSKRILPEVDNNPYLLNIYNNLNGVFLFIPLMWLTGEIETVMEYHLLKSPYFWMMMCLSGLFGIAIGYVTGLQIQVTSPLTHNVSGTAKACAQTVLAVFINNSLKTNLWWLSNGLVLAGSAAYALVRHSEMKSKEKNTSK